MSYQVIARKWRPKTFGELVGQEHISSTLLNALRSHRLAHALLFTGPRGTGKTSTARILAKSLRCQNAKDLVPCDKCSTCLEIASGSSVDVIEIDGASNNGVDAIRELRDTVAYMPATGKWKIYIIDEVHMLSTSAFNALLKTLEEPPAHVVFILATTEVQKIPATILSRCQRFDFRRIPLKQVVAHLEKIAQAEGATIDSTSLWMIARQGEGSMRDAQSLLDQIVNFCDKKVTQQKVIEVLGLTDRALVMETVSALIARDTNVTLKIIEKVYTGGFDSKIFCQEILEELRNLLIIKLSPENALVDLPENEIEFLKKESTKVSAEDIHTLFDMALKGAGDIMRAQDAKLVLEMVLLRMAMAPRFMEFGKFVESQPAVVGARGNTATVAVNNDTHTDTMTAKKDARGGMSASTTNQATSKMGVNPNTPNYAPQHRPTATELPTETQTQTATGLQTPNSQLSARWSDFVHKIKNLNSLVGSKLENTHLLKIEGDKMVIGVPQALQFLHNQAADADFVKKVSNYLSTFWGKSYKIELVVEDEALKHSPKAQAEKKKQDQDEAMKQKVEEHPLVQKVKTKLNSKVQSIKEYP